MAKFNTTKTKGPQVVNKAGGRAYVKDAEHELVSRLLSWFVNGGYYESQGEGIIAIRNLVHSIKDKKFVAKAAIYARDEFHMRSVTHLLTCELFHSGVSGKPWLRKFVYSVVHRVDDITEILAYWMSLNQKALPNALKEGLSDAFNKFNTYQLGKYQAKGSALSLVDAVRLVHPSPTKANKEGLAQLIEGTLKADGTRQAQLVAATKDLKTEDERRMARKGVLIEQVDTMCYMELLKNITSYFRDCPEKLPRVAERLVDEEAIKRAKLFPFRFFNASRSIQANFFQQKHSRVVLTALNTALDIACDNVPKLENTLVVVDVSGSMDCGLSVSAADERRHAKLGTRPLRCCEAAGLMGAILGKSVYADLMVFASDAAYLPYNPGDSTMTIAEQLGGTSGCDGHGTNFNAIFARASKGYDRIVIFSDMQGWMGDEFFCHSFRNNGAPTRSLASYKKEYKCDPFVYSVNLRENGGSMFNMGSQKVIPLAGHSEKLFDLMAMAEEDREILLSKVNAVRL